MIDVEVAQVQPLRREVGHQRSRSRVGEHAPHLLLEHRRLCSVPRIARSSSSSSGMLLQRKNDSRDASSRSLMRYGVFGGTPAGIVFDAEQELRADQHGRQRHFDAASKPPVRARLRDRASAGRRDPRR